MISPSPHTWCHACRDADAADYNSRDFSRGSNMQKLGLIAKKALVG